LVGIENLVLLACGTSLNAAYAVMHLFKQLKIFGSVTAIEASEFCLNDLASNKPGVIVIS
jgi:fructoselysine-6-P-deglycase FrlB-like protein